MIYVIAQFILLIVIIWPMPYLQVSIIGFIFIFIATLIAFVTLISNRPGNFNIRPQPKAMGTLIVDGPYKYIRHPMYSALFFGCLGILFCQFNIWKLCAWLLLVLVLTLKARFEEKALCPHYVQYKDYQKTNKAFIPWLW